MQVLDHITEEIAVLVRDARRVVVLTGAGISAESGVPTFREVQTGLWERFSAEDLATVDAFHNDPPLVWTWYRWRQSLIQQVEPNPGHTAIARWQKRARADRGTATPTSDESERARIGADVTVATQNVDDLHERAGTEVLAHLHGSIFAHRCIECGVAAELPAPRYNGFEAPPEPENPPACEHCGAHLRPGVVWFGEMLPMEAFESTAAAVRAADLVVVAGTSGIVQPAASLPLLALERGTPLIEVNPEETELSEVMDYCLRGSSGTMLPKLVESAA